MWPVDDDAGPGAFEADAPAMTMRTWISKTRIRMTLTGRRCLMSHHRSFRTTRALRTRKTLAGIFT